MVDAANSLVYYTAVGYTTTGDATRSRTETIHEFARPRRCQWHNRERVRRRTHGAVVRLPQPNLVTSRDIFAQKSRVTSRNVGRFSRAARRRRTPSASSGRRFLRPRSSTSSFPATNRRPTSSFLARPIVGVAVASRGQLPTLSPFFSLISRIRPRSNFLAKTQKK